MQYIFRNKKVFTSCVEYLKNKKIAYAEHVVGDIYILVVFEQDKKNLIESEKKEFSLSEDIDLEYGYLVGKNYKVETKFTVKDRLIGSDKATFISGPCSVENEDTMLAIAKKLKWLEWIFSGQEPLSLELLPMIFRELVGMELRY